MNEKTWEIFAQFGIAGLILGVLLAVVITGIWMVRTLVRELSADRNAAEDRWRETFVNVANQSDQRAAETNEVLRDVSGAIKILEAKIQ